VSTRERTAAWLERLLPDESRGELPAQAGLPALPLARPADLEQAREVVRWAAGERVRILPLGLGSKLAWLPPLAEIDLALASTGLSGVLAYEPADGTITARAGTRLSELRARAAQGGHHLSPELPGAAHATLGGTLAAGVSGFDRLRFGPTRHQVLGIDALLADGTLVKSGGRVVKNVTGYDLHRLWCGSRGTLAFLVAASLRLYPLAAEEAVLELECDGPAPALERVNALARARLAPLALVLHGGPQRHLWLALVLAGRSEVVAHELGRAAQILPGARVWRGSEAARERARLCELEREDGSWPPLQLSCRPSRFAAALERALACAAQQGLGARLVAHPLLARAALRFDPERTFAERRDALRRALAAPDLELCWRPALPAPAAEEADPARTLMRRLKQALDPGGVFAGEVLP
jgi:glycolate oxidase FAD binding subunit